jgi:hypothetical protein
LDKGRGGNIFEIYYFLLPWPGKNRFFEKFPWGTIVFLSETDNTMRATAKNTNERSGHRMAFEVPEDQESQEEYDRETAWELAYEERRGEEWAEEYFIRELDNALREWARLFEESDDSEGKSGEE